MRESLNCDVDLEDAQDKSAGDRLWLNATPTTYLLIYPDRNLGKLKDAETSRIFQLCFELGLHIDLKYLILRLLVYAWWGKMTSS